MFYPGTNKRRIMMKGKIEGTTFTGHPSRTTFGNTERMVYYCYYICTKAGIPIDLF